MGTVAAERKQESEALAKSGKRTGLQASFRSRSMHVMGIFDQREADALAAAFASGIDPGRAVAALRWDIVNAWGRTLEERSSHPLVARLIQALEDVPGLPRKTWSV